MRTADVESDQVRHEVPPKTAQPDGGAPPGRLKKPKNKVHIHPAQTPLTTKGVESLHRPPPVDQRYTPLPRVVYCRETISLPNIRCDGWLKMKFINGSFHDSCSAAGRGPLQTTPNHYLPLLRAADEGGRGAFRQRSRLFISSHNSEPNLLTNCAEGASRGGSGRVLRFCPGHFICISCSRQVASPEVLWAHKAGGFFV
jgi:hypothetical protein